MCPLSLSVALLSLLGVAADPATLQIGSCTISEVGGRLQSSCPIDYMPPAPPAPPAQPPPAQPPATYTLLGAGCCDVQNATATASRMDRVLYQGHSSVNCAQRCTEGGHLCVAYTHWTVFCYIDLVDGGAAAAETDFPGNNGVWDDTDGYSTNSIIARTDGCTNHGWSCYVKD